MGMLDQFGQAVNRPGVKNAIAAVFGDQREIDAIRTERRRAQLAENAIAAQEQDLADQAATRTARAGAVNADGTFNQGGFGAYVTIAPHEAMALKASFDAMDEGKRAEAIAAAKAKTEQSGRIAAWIAGSDDPAAAYAQAYAGMPEDLREGMPPQYDPNYVDFMLAQASETDDMLGQLDRKRKGNALRGALGVVQGVHPQPPQANAIAASTMEGVPTTPNAPAGYRLPETQGGDMATRLKAGLVARGLPEHVAEGFVLNFDDEANLDPGINEENPTVAGSRGGFGLAQWTGPRRVGLEKFAQESGRALKDPEMQLDYLMMELSGPEAGAASRIMSTQNRGEAAAAIARFYLRPAQEHLDRRVAEYTGGRQNQPRRPDVSSALASLVEAGVDQGTIDLVMKQLAGPQPQSPEGKLYADQQAGLAPLTSGQPAPSAAEQQIVRIAETLLQDGTATDERDAWQLAVGIADGRVRADRDPVTGVLQVVDMATGQTVRGVGAQEGASAPDPMEIASSSMPTEGANWPGATGVEGFVSGLANTVSEIVGGGLIAPENERAIQALKNLNAQTVTSLAQITSDGRPSVWLMQRLEGLAVTPGSPFQGPGRARERLTQTRDMLEEAITLNMTVAQTDVNPTRKSEARANIERLRQLRDSFETVLDGFGGSSRGGGESGAGDIGSVIEKWTQ